MDNQVVTGRGDIPAGLLIDTDHMKKMRNQSCCGYEGVPFVKRLEAVQKVFLDRGTKQRIQTYHAERRMLLDGDCGGEGGLGSGGECWR